MDEFAILYGKLRAALLSRHFAINNQFRINFLSNESQLHPNDKQLVDRWNVDSRYADNPLMGSGMLMTCLAVEHYLGRPDALRIIHALTDTIGSLYKFSGNHFDGYIIRWDPVLGAEEKWVAEDNRRYNRAFFLNQDLTYNYSTPFHDPRSRRPLSRVEWEAASQEERTRLRERDVGYWHFFDHFRRWEASMDELVGLIMGYDMTYRLVNNASVRDNIRRQANNLGDYLAEHGYYLVRPRGGFNARGSSGFLPALEYPFSRVFLRITNNPYNIRNDFQTVMEKADVWKALEGPFNSATVTGIAIHDVLTCLYGFINGVVLPMGLSFLFGATSPFPAVELARIWQIWVHRDVFDVMYYIKEEDGYIYYNDGYASEFALAYALSLLNSERRFDDFMNGAQLIKKGWSRYFPPFLGLTGMDDQKPNVSTAYFNWLHGRRQANNQPDDAANSTFASAVAVLLEAGVQEEQNLVNLLNEQLIFFNDKKIAGDLVIRPDEGGINFESLGNPDPDDPSLENKSNVLGYMAALALAWLHRKRCQDKGHPVTTPGFPEFPDASPWPLAAVPADVLKEAKEGKIILPISEIQSNTPLHLEPDGAADLFYDDPVVRRSPIPPGLLPKFPISPSIKENFTVRESDHYVSTGIILRMGDEFEIKADGRIWAGVWLCRENGPNGWEDRIEYDRKFPLTGQPNGHPYCLLGKLGDDGAYFFIGKHRPRERYLGEETRELFLCINDDLPGNGSGYFSVEVSVWGQIGSRVSCIIPDLSEDSDRRIDAIGGEHADGARWLINLDEAIALVENGHQFYIESPEGDRVEIILAIRRGTKYLKTVADHDEPNNLLALPKCNI